MVKKPENSSGASDQIYLTLRCVFPQFFRKKFCLCIGGNESAFPGGLRNQNKPVSWLRTHFEV